MTITIDYFFEPCDDPGDNLGTGKDLDQSLEGSPEKLDLLRRRLTQRQIRYIEWLVVLGEEKDAARQAGYQFAPRMTGPMRSYLSELSKNNESPLIGDAQERQMMLTRILRDDPYLDPKIQCEVINLLNKMQGCYNNQSGLGSGMISLEYDLVKKEDWS